VNAIAAAAIGFDRAETQLGSAALALSNSSSPSDAGGGDITELSAAMLSLIEARNTTAVSVKIVHTADEMQKDLLNLLA